MRSLDSQAYAVVFQGPYGHLTPQIIFSPYSFSHSVKTFDKCTAALPLGPQKFLSLGQIKTGVLIGVFREKQTIK